MDMVNRVRFHIEPFFSVLFRGSAFCFFFMGKVDGENTWLMVFYLMLPNDILSCAFDLVVFGWL